MANHVPLKSALVMMYTQGARNVKLEWNTNLKKHLGHSAHTWINLSTVLQDLDGEEEGEHELVGLK